MLIKPSTAIRQDYKGFSEMCHATDEPVVLTRNGEADLVVMSWESYQKAEAWLKLRTRLWDAEREIENGEPTLTLDEVFDPIWERLGAGKE